MENLNHYIIQGGSKGRERLKLLSRIMEESTTALFDRLGIESGAVCLDVGCGGGDVTTEIARRVMPSGKVVGIDLDAEKLELARLEAEQLGITNVEFKLLDIREHLSAQDSIRDFDLVYARFLLTHLPDPASAVDAFYAALKPGGLVIVEDIDISGSFVFPESEAFRRHDELYCEAVRRRGGDPDIGPRLPLLIKNGGFMNIGLKVVQPMGMEGEVKLIRPVTMENIAETVVQMGLASSEEVADLIKEMYDFVASPSTIAGTPRVIQAWGRKPAE